MRDLLLVGVLPNDVKVFGPFETPDEAREFANLLGLADARWAITTAITPSTGQDR